MHFKKLLELLGLAATAYAAAVPDTPSDGDPDSCIQDECLSALRIPWRLGQAKQDCGKWWVTTVTPPAVTVTATTTTDTTTTTTSSTTLTSTTTTTSTISITSTNTESCTDVETSTSTAWTTVVTEAGSWQKRAAEGEADAAEALPPYAGACNRAKYRSACGCIGVHQKTVTAATPTVTATATATSTSTSSTVTTSSTTTTSTSLETTSVTSTTETTTTTTTGVVTTQTATCSKFYILVTYGDGSTGYVTSESTGGCDLTIQSWKPGAQCFFLDANNWNTLTTAGNNAQYIGAVNEPQDSTGPQPAHLDENSGSLPSGDVAITCNPPPGSNALNCAAGTYTSAVDVEGVLNFQPAPQLRRRNNPKPVTLSAVCCD